MLVSAGLSPHPPIIIPEVGGAELQAAERTVTAMRAWAKEIAPTNPETLVFISPHAPFLQRALAWLGGPELTGSFAAFGAPEVAFRVKSDRELAASIAAEAAEEGVQVDDKVEGYDDYGKFGWIMDPEGNRVELWEPPKTGAGD